MTAAPSHPVQPPLWRVVTGFVVAPAIAAILMAVIEQAGRGLPDPLMFLWLAGVIALLGAYPAALFGIPAYMILSEVRAPRLLYCALTGAIVAAIPWALVTVLLPNPQSASIGGIPSVIDGTRTAHGWLLQGQFLLQIAGLGAASGAAFWAIVVPRRRLTRRTEIR